MIMAPAAASWHHQVMIAFRTLSDEHPDLAHSPLLRAAPPSYARFEERPFGKWDEWMNVINVKADHGTTERELFASFYGEEHDWDHAGWREMAAFYCVLRPLELAGLLVQTREEREGRHVHHVFKTPLWRSALQLDVDDMLRPVALQ